MGDKEDVVDRLLNRRKIKVDGKLYRVEKDKTLILNTIDSYLVKRHMELKRNGKEF